MANVKTRLLLFCKERRNSARALYFVEFNTMTQRSPRVHRFYASKKLFDSMLPGGRYTLELRELHIIRCSLESEFIITEPYYALLMELRELAFLSRPQTPIKRFDSNQYYSFDELRSLLAYREQPLHSAMRLVCTHLMMGLSAIIPAAVYFVFLYLLFAIPVVSPWVTPIISICALPFIFTLMYALHIVAEFLLLQWPFTRYYMLQQFTLRNAGARRPIVMPPATKRRILLMLFASFSFSALSTLLLLVK